MAKVRIENTSFLIDGVSFYHASTAIGFQTASAQFTYNNVVKHARELTHGNLAKWASYSSDTCAIQKSFWEIMNSTAETRHVLTVPCDSHGLQLISKTYFGLAKIIIETQLLQWENSSNRALMQFSVSSPVLISSLHF
ncbi:hypothetical protein GcC1_110017 [Golovinomyces cichoracearum]|uniref:DUF659 domain-containing protein n=1 Tax=Golovinomyces cichoracearum TaxID=62708 RepID=A0A420I8U1_9PEZI|nr:hypothetical protein GcC1_110017 [Golovinomyces cichoracearum]